MKNRNLMIFVNHFHHQVYIVTLLLLTVIIFSPVSANENRAACYKQCVSDYGTVLGTTAKGIKAYSNCNNDCVIFEPNKHNGTYTGIKWQCVEFARRWLLVNHGVVYGDVDFAIDIWDKITYYTNVKTSKQVPVTSHLNGSEQPPRTGDLLIYAKALLGTGHVAVVTGVNKEKNKITIGEQNYKNSEWSDDHARSVDYINRNGKYWVLDPYLIGWKHSKFN